MPQPIHPLPVNPTTGQQPLANLRSVASAPPASAAGGGGVSRDVLKQLQDVAWSDDEDDPDCMVCAEPLDLSDQNFKPCQCGMQICQFCYNKLLHDDPRCPGCRRPYDANAVVYQPVNLDEVRRAKEKKTKRAKIIKQLEGMGRRHLLATRIVMKNSVYVVGMRIPGSGDESEAVSILRSNDYFGQYGKVAKIYLRDRTATSSTSVPTLTPDNPGTSTGIHIVYVRREDAARAIQALDGHPAPAGPPGQMLHASYGTTRYCDAFLRGVKCDNSNCPNLHEWGGEGDCFTKNDLDTALTRPAEYDARQKQAIIQPPPLVQKAVWPKPAVEEVDSSALPRTASWGVRPAPARPLAANSRVQQPVGASRPTKLPSTLVPLGTKAHAAAFPLPTPSPAPAVKEKKEKRATTMSRARSGSSISSSAPGLVSAQASPKKKPTPLQVITPSPVDAIANGTNGEVDSPPSIEAELQPEPMHESPPTVARPSPSSEPPSDPGPSTRRPTGFIAEYPIHSPYPDFDDAIALDPASGFTFSLALDDAEIAARLAEADYEPLPFDPLFDELPKFGIALASVLAAAADAAQPVGQYHGPFSPFHFDDGLNGDGLGALGDDGQSDNEARTSSRFGFARRASLASSGRGMSPFRGEGWKAAALGGGGLGGLGGLSPLTGLGSQLTGANGANVGVNGQAAGGYDGPPGFEWEQASAAAGAYRYDVYDGRGRDSPVAGLGAGQGRTGAAGAGAAQNGYYDYQQQAQQAQQVGAYAGAGAGAGYRRF
ncbi:transcriptional repressor general negative regulator of transcription subunit 4 [Cryptotrichosporon argae]